MSQLTVERLKEYLEQFPNHYIVRGVSRIDNDSDMCEINFRDGGAECGHAQDCLDYYRSSGRKTIEYI